ncbi:hypothetical protein HCH73_19075 [Citrobacter koseri]|uniref:hypothetical protein n=1 Tax=Citrobacter koseri TaxID=545 RepID=UPI0018E1A089|nr:hypothetical protein [Citrobacter koseri]MBI0679132.1 hypothetical protein [Citrobacter koseri]
MKSYIKNTAQVTGLVFAAITAAHASVDTDTVTTASAPLQFGAQATVTHVLTAVSDTIDPGLSNSQVLATGTVTPSDPAASVVVRYTPGFENQAVKSPYDAIITNDDDGEVEVSIRNPDATPMPVVDSSNRWLGMGSGPSDYALVSGDQQSVKPGSYTVSIDAAIWTS